MLVCCNGDGTDKVPLWVVGKFQNPRCFKNLNRESLGCQYRWSTKAWMTQTIFLEWIKAFDERMAGRQVLHILDNCNAHIPVAELKDHVQLQNTTVLYLPPNSTSKIQPSDAGIIRNLKAYYRRRFNSLLLNNLEENVTEPEKISVLDTICMAVAVWSLDVKQETIKNCFLHWQIRSTGTEEALGQTVADTVGADLLQELDDQIRRLRYSNPMKIENLLNYPGEEEVAFEPTEEDIIESLKQVESSNSDADDNSIELPRVSTTDALESLKTLEAFWLQQEGNNADFLRTIQKMKDSVQSIKTNRMIQMPISHFFERR